MTKGPQQFEAGRILASTDGAIGKAGAGKMLSINRGGHEARRPPDPQFEKTELLDVVAFLEDFEHELSDALSVFAPDPYVRMTLHLIRSHLEAKTVTPTSLIGASGVPYATATRRIGEMIENGLIDQRPRTRSGKTFSMHPSEKLLESWMQLSGRLQRLAETRLMRSTDGSAGQEYYWRLLHGSPVDPASAGAGRTVAACRRRPRAGAWRSDLHGDGQSQAPVRAGRRHGHSPARLFHRPAAPGSAAQRRTQGSRYDIIAVDLPWIGEFAEKDVLMPLDEAWTLTGWIRPISTPPAGRPRIGAAPLWRPCADHARAAVLSQGLFAEAGMEPPATDGDVIKAAKSLHDPAQGATE
jgi:multiple sugar transport system substrate-binding protein